MNNYIVYRVYKNNDEKDILFTDLPRDEAMEIVQSTPSEKDSMVVFDEVKS